MRNNDAMLEACVASWRGFSSETSWREICSVPFFRRWEFFLVLLPLPLIPTTVSSTPVYVLALVWYAPLVCSQRHEIQFCLSKLIILSFSHNNTPSQHYLISTEHSQYANLKTILTLLSFVIRHPLGSWLFLFNHHCNSTACRQSSIQQCCRAFQYNNLEVSHGKVGCTLCSI